MKVHCITLTQPFATLAVRGLKPIETRSYIIKNKEQLETIREFGLYIHAGLSKTVVIDGKKINCRDLCEQPFFKEAIGGSEGYDKLTFGAIVGKVGYFDEYDRTENFEITQRDYLKWNIHGKKYITEQDFAFGDFSPNRYGWLLHEPIEFTQPIFCSGNLGIWNYEFIPKHIGCETELTNIQIIQFDNLQYNSKPAYSIFNTELKTKSEIGHILFNENSNFYCFYPKLKFVFREKTLQYVVQFLKHLNDKLSNASS